jgi:hypothetical protein
MRSKNGGVCLFASGTLTGVGTTKLVAVKLGLVPDTGFLVVLAVGALVAALAIWGYAEVCRQALI